MGLFDKKEVKALESKVTDLEGKIQAQQEAIEKKGYFDGLNDNNEFFKQLNKSIQTSVQLLDFGSAQDRTVQMNYYRDNAIVRGIVDTTIGNAVGELGQFVELVDAKGKPIDKHWALDLLRTPNDLDTMRDILKYWSINYDVTGNAFLYGEPMVGLSKGQFRALYVMPSHIVDIVRGKDRPIEKYVLSVNSYNFSASNLIPDNVMFSRQFNPDYTTVFGLSPLVSAASKVQLLEASDKRQHASITSGGVGAVITPKGDNFGVTPVQAANVEQELNAKHYGNFLKYFPYEVVIQKTGDTPTDLGLLDTSKDAITALCFVYGISVDSYLGQGKYENTQEAKKAIYQMAAIPRLNVFLDAYGKFCKLKNGEKFILNTDRIEILKKSATEMMTTFDLAGVSLNDRMEFMGYPRYPDKIYDQPMVKMGYTFGYEPIIPINENV